MSTVYHCSQSTATTDKIRNASQHESATVISRPDATFTNALRQIVGSRQVLTERKLTRHFRTGFRHGSGEASAVVRPGSLIELWRVLEACLLHGKIVIMQAANTGLTGGSTPAGEYDRDVVIISTLRMRALHVINGGRSVICLPGVTLDQLERALAPYKREPHSLIGSSCLGASVVGGICNNSGGALIRRGPAHTQHALYAQVDTAGQLHLTNHLGIELGRSPEEILQRLDRGDMPANPPADLIPRQGSDREYVRRVQDVDSDTPARFNADPRNLFNPGIGQTSRRANWE